MQQQDCEQEIMPNHLQPPNSALDRRKSEDDRGDLVLEEMEAQASAEAEIRGSHD
jgi:hypothetical protein